MSKPLIELHQTGKRFCRSPLDAIRNESLRFLQRRLRRSSPMTLGPGEFWALRGIDLSVSPGECIGIIGPNGAGKSTLLRLINQDYRPDAGQIVRRGRVTSLLRIGSGLHPLLSGRENIQLHLTAQGLNKARIDRHLDAIITMAGLEKVVDRPVKQYSDGLYSRLQFAMTTALPLDILLIDEVLSVGDMAFQARSLEHIRALKQQGTTVLMVSHSEMNIRWVADRCLLLFDGEMLGCGAPDELYQAYYHAVGFQHPRQGHQSPRDNHAQYDGLVIETLRCNGDETRAVLQTDTPAEFLLVSRTRESLHDLTLVVQFRNTRDELVASLDSGHAPGPLSLGPGTRQIRIRLPMTGLMPGVYQVSAGFRRHGTWISHTGDSLRLTVQSGRWCDDMGSLKLPARFEFE